MGFGCSAGSSGTFFLESASVVVGLWSRDQRGSGLLGCKLLGTLLCFRLNNKIVYGSLRHTCMTMYITQLVATREPLSMVNPKTGNYPEASQERP